MEFTNAKVEEIIQNSGIIGLMEHVDLCAGICYGRTSTHNTEQKQSDFVESLINKGHMRPLEFGTVYLTFTDDDPIAKTSFFNSPYCTLVTDSDNKHIHYLTTNLRFIVENRLMFLNNYWSEPTKHKRRRTFKFTCSRAIADEFRTHVTLSSLMMSTRYCKFKNLQIIKPYWYDTASSDTQYAYKSAMIKAEQTYQFLLDNGCKPQEARGVLPMDMQTELLMCGEVNDLTTGWDRFIQMRCDKHAHPDAQMLANQIKDIIYNE